MNLNNLSNNIQQLARSVGKYLIDEQGKLNKKDIELKGARNYVTYIDKAAEELLVEGLQRLLPESGFLTEEATVEFEDKELMWIIDPLDGTSNYVHGDTTYSVSIALTHNKKTVLGLVHEPVSGNTYHAVEGDTAFVNDKPLQVSKHATIKNGYFGFGIPYSMNEKGEKILLRALKQSHLCSFRLKGSAALDLCHVAAGITDAFFHSGLSPWDVAAGAFIVEKAGGKCVDFSSGNNFIFGKEIVATNSVIHKEIMDTIIAYDEHTG